MKVTLMQQILDVRDSGNVNMFDVRSVQAVAGKRGHLELVLLIEERADDYVRFIMDGDEERLGDGHAGA